MFNDITKPIVNNINEISKSIPGWCPEDELFSLYLLALTTKDLEGELLEIGSFCGKSSSVLAMAAQKIDTKLNCVDLFPDRNDWFQETDGTYNFNVNINNRIYSLGNYRFWKEPYLNQVVPIYERYGDSLEDTFLNNLKSLNLDSNVKHIRGTTLEFSETFDSKVKFVFIDGDHSYEGVRKDMENIERFLVKGAWIAFDDAFASYPENDRAIKELIIDSNKYECFQQLTRKCFACRKK